jgi:hypothetical protein
VLFKFHQIFPRDRPNTPTTFSSTTTELRANGKPEPADLNHRSPPHPPDRRWIGPTVRACQRGPTKPGLVFEPPQALLFSPCLSHSKRERERDPHRNLTSPAEGFARIFSVSIFLGFLHVRVQVRVFVVVMLLCFLLYSLSIVRLSRLCFCMNVKMITCMDVRDDVFFLKNLLGSIECQGKTSFYVF